MPDIEITTYDAQLEKIVLSMKAINIILEGNVNNAKSLSKGAEDEPKDDEKELREDDIEPIEEPVEDLKKGGE